MNIIKNCLLFVGGVIVGGVVAARTTVKHLNAVAEETRNRLQRSDTSKEEA